MHDFNESLLLSAKYADAPWWEQIYRQAFPNLQSMSYIRQDGWAQRGGIDRVLVLDSGKTLRIEEKVRDNDYGDILLEVWSDHQRRVPGWMQKDLATDYLSYCVLPGLRCYILPFPLLRRAWLSNRDEWEAAAEKRQGGFRWSDAKNRNYVTRSVAVPTETLMAALASAMMATWVKVEPLTVNWPEIVTTIDGVDKKVAALLRDAAPPEGWQDDTVPILFKHGFHRDQIELPQNRAIVEATLSTQIGRAVMVRCELAQN